MAQYQYPMERYFPAELFEELERASSETEIAAGTASMENAEPRAGEDTGNASNDTSGAADGDASGSSNNAQTEPQFDVVHTVRYVRVRPFEVGPQTESLVIGTCGTASEANDLAMREVYEKYGGVAHWVQGQPPSPTWLRRVGAQRAGSWPNTWKIEDGCLSFELVIGSFNFTLHGEISVVKR